MIDNYVGTFKIAGSGGNKCELKFTEGMCKRIIKGQRLLLLSYQELMTELLTKIALPPPNGMAELEYLVSANCTETAALRKDGKYKGRVSFAKIAIE